MKLSRIYTTALILLITWTGVSADMRDFTLVNNTSWTINNVFIAETNDPNWGNDVLGVGTLASGNSTSITFTGGSSCVSDIRIRFSENADLLWRNVNFCRVLKMSVSYDFEGKYYKADWIRY